MSEYGYIPEAPTQSWGDNKGIFTANDVYDLTNQEKWTHYGQLELIETRTISSSTATIDFTSLGDYKVHFMTAHDMHNDSNNRRIGVQFFESGTIEDGAVYNVSSQFGNMSGTFIDVQGSGYGSLRWGDNFGNNTNETMNGYMYFHSLLDPATYSFVTHHAVTQSESNAMCFEFGAGVLPQASAVSGIRIEIDSGHDFASGTLSLYGIKEY